jgi:hypothetical protein
MKKISFVVILWAAFFMSHSMIFASPDSGYDAALKYYAKGKYEEAVKYLEEYVQTKPEPAAYYLIGYSLYKLGRFSEADEYFNQAYLIDPTFLPEKIGLSQKYPPVKPKKAKKRVKGHKQAVAPKQKSGVVEGKSEKQGVMLAQIPAKKSEKETHQKQPDVAKTPPQKALTPAATAELKKAGPQNVVPPQKALTPTATAEPKKAGPQNVIPQRAEPQKTEPQNSALNKPTPSATVSPFPTSRKAMPRVSPLVSIPIFFAVYLFGSLCLFLIAKKLEIPFPWIAWVPIIQIWTVVSAAGKPWWWLLLLLIPIYNAVLLIYLWMCIAENLGKNRWLGLLMLLPLINLVFLAILAFSKTEKASGKPDYMFGDEHPDEHPA